jgi:hypothetical protein
VIVSLLKESNSKRGGTVSEDLKKGTKYKVNVTPAVRRKIDEAVSAAAGKHAIVAALDKRHTGKVGTYAPYERYLLEGDFTVFVSLDTFKASMSSKPDRFAAGRVEKRQKRAEKAAARKAAKEAKAAEPSKAPKTKATKPEAAQ